MIKNLSALSLRLHCESIIKDINDVQVVLDSEAKSSPGLRKCAIMCLNRQLEGVKDKAEIIKDSLKDE